MKAFIKILSVLFLAGIVFTSCEDEDKTYQGDEFIHFDKESVVKKESTTDTIDMPVYLAGELPKSDVEVSFTVETSAVAEDGTVDESDYKIVQPEGNTITFEAGTAVAHIQMVLFNNVETDKNKMVTITLDNAEGYVMGLPGSQAKKSFTLTIQDDDCPFVAENFTGKPEGTDLGANAQVEFSLKEKINENKAVYEVTGIFMPQIESFGEEVLESNPTLITLDNTDPTNPTVTLEGSETDQTGWPLLYNTQGGGSTWQYYIYQSSQEATFSTCARSVTVYYDVGLGENYSTNYGQPYWTGLELNVTFSSKKSLKVKDMEVSQVDLKSKMK